MPSPLTYDRLRAERRAAQVRAIDAAELRRMTTRRLEGMSDTAIAKLHGISPHLVNVWLADVPKPAKTKMKRQAPQGLGGP